MKGILNSVATVLDSPLVNLILYYRKFILGYKMIGRSPVKVIMYHYQRKPWLSSKSVYLDQQTKMIKPIKLSLIFPNVV